MRSLQDRLNGLPKRNEENGCIEWMGSLSRGYGRLTIGSAANGRTWPDPPEGK